MRYPYQYTLYCLKHIVAIKVLLVAQSAVLIVINREIESAVEAEGPEV
jgi:hypothetical protein